MTQVLFVCHGNICRSPMAEYLFKDLAAKAGLAEQFVVGSAAKCNLLLDHARPPRTEIGAEVDDPWYSGDFAAAWRDIYPGCTGLLEELS